MANATQTASNMADKAKETASNVADKTKDLAAQAADKAKDFGKSAADFADNATAKVGSGVEAMADKLRDKAPREGVMHDAAAKVANTLEKGGHYLKEEGLTGMADDLTSLIKRHPLPAVLVGIGIGYLIAHTLRK